MRVRLGAGVLAVLAWSAGACASHKPPAAPPPQPAEASAKADAETAKAPVVEQGDEALKRALAAFKAHPSAATEVAVAERYLSLNIYDKASDHFAAAAKRDKKNAQAAEGLARTWRDWGAPELGLAEANRAVYSRPDWAAAQNTLGTVLLATGQSSAAEHAFKKATALEPGAAYLHSNLCYLYLLRGDAASARSQCDTALSLEPTLGAARNNLALLEAAEGDLDAAEKLLASGGADPLKARYNFGIVLMARGEFARAAEAFGDVCRADTAVADACTRAKSARLLIKPGR